MTKMDDKTKKALKKVIGEKDISALGKKTLKELSRLAFDEEVPLKTRCDILRWITELSIGKGGKGSEEKDNKIEIKLHVEK